MGPKIAFFPIGEVTSRIGTRGEWRHFLEALTRAGVIYLEEGVNFSLIMTAADPRGFALIYEEVRAEIIRRGLRLTDINVAPRVRERGRRARSESLETEGTDNG